jgi:predicted ATPase/DNA-binding winged helix-turn-helix (wHTH) protein
LREPVLAFGPFRLLVIQRVLMEGEKPIRIGSRALEILFCLVESAGEIVSKDELVARVWPNISVEEGTLRVHIAALRRALRDRRDGHLYVENVPGHGYRFAAPVTRDEAEVSSRPGSATEADRHINLPSPLARIIGRSQIINTLAARLMEHRLVTIVGPGGVGKTTVAIAVANNVSDTYEHGVCFVDLGSLTDPLLVPPTLASLLGLATSSENLTPSLVTFLADRQMLLVFDNCEHVIDSAAQLAETMLGGAPRVQVLSTSREPLRAWGEAVHRLAALEIPPSSAGLTAAQALTSPAVQLFVERAMATLSTFELRDADVPIVVDLCRRLDGLPLAIELIAAQVDHLDLRDLASSIGDGIQMAQPAHRSALPRHQSLKATLDWSYRLLSESEQLTLRRVAIFAGGFDLSAASAIASDSHVTAAEVTDNILGLADRSLIIVDTTGEDAVYRLLDTTRAYALEKLQASGEWAEISRRHASYLRVACETEPEP